MPESLLLSQLMYRMFKNSLFLHGSEFWYFPFQLSQISVHSQTQITGTYVCIKDKNLRAPDFAENIKIAKNMLMFNSL